MATQGFPPGFPTFTPPSDDALISLLFLLSERVLGEVMPAADVKRSTSENDAMRCLDKTVCGNWGGRFDVRLANKAGASKTPRDEGLHSLLVSHYSICEVVFLWKTTTARS